MSAIGPILIWLLIAFGLGFTTWAIRECVLIGRQVRDIERRVHLQREVQATCNLYPPMHETRRWLHDEWIRSVGRDVR
ncbi:hypothetical protein [Plantactinospora sp. WMMB782]|uniref:hypothetical protein n=1 Tax=Plantactinospora sp. WMMB782 TaxID=3404121 RepID=UPI003B93D341